MSCRLEIPFRDHRSDELHTEAFEEGIIRRHLARNGDWTVPELAQVNLKHSL
jgi:hypothetical protein